MTLPTTVKPGKDYYFRISDAKNADQVVVTPNFEVRRKIPLLLKAIPIVAVGGVIYVLSMDKNKSSDLEGPPLVPPN